MKSDTTDVPEQCQIRTQGKLKSGEKVKNWSWQWKKKWKRWKSKSGKNEENVRETRHSHFRNDR